jgi:hypothetical protein
MVYLTKLVPHLNARMLEAPSVSVTSLIDTRF